MWKKKVVSFNFAYIWSQNLHGPSNQFKKKPMELREEMLRILLNFVARELLSNCTYNRIIYNDVGTSKKHQWIVAHQNCSANIVDASDKFHNCLTMAIDNIFESTIVWAWRSVTSLTWRSFVRVIRTWRTATINDRVNMTIGNISNFGAFWLSATWMQPNQQMVIRTTTTSNIGTATTAAIIGITTDFSATLTQLKPKPHCIL